MFQGHTASLWHSAGENLVGHATSSHTLCMAVSPQLEAPPPQPGPVSSAGRWTMRQLPCKWFQEQTGRAGGFMKPLPQGLGWGPANICKPLVWRPLEQMCLFSKNHKDSTWKQNFILTGMHPELVPHFPCFCPGKARYVVWPNLEKQFAML